MVDGNGVDGCRVVVVVVAMDRGLLSCCVPRIGSAVQRWGSAFNRFAVIRYRESI